MRKEAPPPKKGGTGTFACLGSVSDLLRVSANRFLMASHLARATARQRWPSLGFGVLDSGPRLPRPCPSNFSLRRPGSCSEGVVWPLPCHRLFTGRSVYVQIRIGCKRCWTEPVEAALKCQHIETTGRPPQVCVAAPVSLTVGGHSTLGGRESAAATDRPACNYGPGVRGARRADGGPPLGCVGLGVCPAPYQTAMMCYHSPRLRIDHSMSLRLPCIAPSHTRAWVPHSRSLTRAHTHTHHVIRPCREEHRTHGLQ